MLAELLASLARCIELLGKDCLGVTGLEVSFSHHTNTVIYRLNNEILKGFSTYFLFILVYQKYKISFIFHLKTHYFLLWLHNRSYLGYSKKEEIGR